jgi:hypothetical protein
MTKAKKKRVSTGSTTVPVEVEKPPKVPTLEEIEKIGFPEFVRQTGLPTYTGAYSALSNGDRALSLLNTITPILASKRITYRQYFERDTVACQRFYEFCGLIKPQSDTWQSVSRYRLEED